MRRSAITFAAFFFFTATSSVLATSCLPGNSFKVTHVRGVVLNPLGEPVPNAKIQIKKLKEESKVAETTSDAGGKFVLKAVKPGKYIMKVSSSDFQVGTQEFEVVPSSHSTASSRRAITVRLAPGMFCGSIGTDNR